MAGRRVGMYVCGGLQSQDQAVPNTGSNDCPTDEHPGNPNFGACAYAI
jgi:hypothetical protein